MTVKELKLQKIEELKKTKTLEEIIKASWGLLKYTYSNLSEKDEVLELIDIQKNNYYKGQLETKRDKVYEELVTNFISCKDDNIIDRVCDATNLEWWEVKELILTKENPNKVDKSLAKYILKAYPQDDRKERELKHRIMEAKVKVSIVEKTAYPTFTEFRKHNNMVSKEEINYAYEIVKKYDQEYYKTLTFPFDIKKKKRNNLVQARNLHHQSTSIDTSKQVINGLSESSLSADNVKELVMFCENYELPILLVKKYIALLKDNRSDFFNLDCDKQVEKLVEYKKTELEKAQPIIEDLILIKDKNSYKKTIDYYYFYKNGFYRDYFVRLLTLSHLHNISYLFSDYSDKHRKSFECFDNREIYTYAKKESMFLDGEFVSYKAKDFLGVVNELKSEDLPLSKGLICQKIQEKEKKNTDKTIVKKRSI